MSVEELNRSVIFLLDDMAIFNPMSYVGTGRAREDDRKSDLDRLLEKGADPSQLVVAV